MAREVAAPLVPPDLPGRRPHGQRLVRADRPPAGGALQSHPGLRRIESSCNAESATSTSSSASFAPPSSARRATSRVDLGRVIEEMGRGALKVFQKACEDLSGLLELLREQGTEPPPPGRKTVGWRLRPIGTPAASASHHAAPCPLAGGAKFMLDDTGPRPAQDQGTTTPGAAFSASGRARDSAGVLPYRPHSGVYPGINPVPAGRSP